MILVAGSTGVVGGEVCRQLCVAGEPVRALVRAGSDPDKVARLEELGCLTVVGDLRDRASLDLACAGVTSVVTTVSAIGSWSPPDATFATVDRAGTMALIDAAADAGVQHLSYLSASADPHVPLTDTKRDVEAYLRRSGLEYTVVRAAAFMESWLSPAVGFDPVRTSATIYGTGDAPTSYISALDVATILVHSLTHPETRLATLRVGGPDALTQLEAVAIFEEVGGRPFTLTYLPVEALDAQLAAAPNELAATFAGLMRSIALGDEVPMVGLVHTLGLTLATVRDYARAVTAAPTTVAG